jgi:hypothetical protein
MASAGVVAPAFGRPEREHAEAVQSLAVAEQVAAVTEHGQGVLVAGGGRRVVAVSCCMRPGSSRA